MPGSSKPAAARPGARTTIAVQGARVHNLKNVSLEFPRDRLIVITGLSGSGKSSLAFDTIYAEGQRRYMESLSSFAKRFVAQVAKPDVDFVFGLSPVISIEQKTTGSNPRSTVGTMTDIASYLNLLFATVAEPHCPRTGERVPPAAPRTRFWKCSCPCPRGRNRVAARRYSGSTARNWTSSSRRSARRAAARWSSTASGSTSPKSTRSTKRQHDMDVVIDQLIIGWQAREGHQGGDRRHAAGGRRPDANRGARRRRKAETERLLQEPGQPDASLRLRRHRAGVTSCSTTRRAPAALAAAWASTRVTHPELARARPEAQHPRRLLRPRGVPVQARYLGRVHYVQPLQGAEVFARHTVGEAARAVRNSILYGLDGPEVPNRRATRSQGEARRIRATHEVGFDGIARWIERHYRRYRQRGEASSGMEAWLEKVMVEHTCPDCQGARLRATRLLFTVAGKTIHEVGDMNFDELHAFLGSVNPAGRGADAGRQVLAEIRRRVDLLLDIGLDYLNLNRRSNTLSGGESQRIRLSTQIGSDLMGMLYVLDEPTIGLHPKDNEKMIATLERLRDLGNSVMVVEHDEDIIRAADHVIEMGPGPGEHGGEVVAHGTMDDILRGKASLTGQFLSGSGESRPRAAAGEAAQTLTVPRRAGEQPARHRCDHPAGSVRLHHRCVRLRQEQPDQRDPLQGTLEAACSITRMLPGKHDGIEGVEYVSDSRQHRPVAHWPHQPRSNPATYIGFYDNIRDLFADTAAAQERGYTPGALQLQHEGRPLRRVRGRRHHHHPAASSWPMSKRLCPVCKGAQYNAETLEVTYRGKTIADVLAMTDRGGRRISSPGEPAIACKLRMLNELGLGYLKLGQSCHQALGRRGAAHQAGLRAGQDQARQAQPVHPG